MMMMMMMMMITMMMMTLYVYVYVYVCVVVAIGQRIETSNMFNKNNYMRRGRCAMQRRSHCRPTRLACTCVKNEYSVRLYCRDQANNRPKHSSCFITRPRRRVAERARAESRRQC